MFASPSGNARTKSVAPLIRIRNRKKPDGKTHRIRGTIAGQMHGIGPSRMLKSLQHGGSYFSLVGSDRVDIARAFCTLLAHERVLRCISA